MVFGSGVFGSGLFGGGAASAGPGSPSRAVPLALRVGNRHITKEVSDLKVRWDAIGGGVSLSVRLSRPLDRFDLDLQGLAKVYLYDARSAECLWEGRLTDHGRGAGSDGQVWDLVAFGPKIHAADQSYPLIYVDQRLEPWKRSEYSTKNASTQTDERPSDTPTLLVAAEEGKSITTSWLGDWIYRAARRCDMKLARVRCDWDAGVTSANYQVELHLRTGTGASGGIADSDTWSTGGGSLVQTVGGTNFANGYDVCSFRATRNTSSTTGAETHWAEFWDIYVRTLLLDQDGSEITTGYTGNYVLAHEVVKDLLGRVLDQYDGANAVVDTTAAHQIDQLAYPDGVTAEQLLDDLMDLEPAYRWYCKPDVTGGGFRFYWELLPTTVRYEVTLDDGGSFPSSWQEVYNQVTVRWTDKDGRPRTTIVTSTVDRFDEEGITRSTTLDLADELGSAAQATRRGQNFLADHAVPRNAGTLNVARPIRDLTSGRMVQPFEIQPGELIRVRGVESYPDALNADSNDGLTVFRIASVTYNSDSHSATLEFDTDSRSTANQLRKALKRRHRKR